MKELFNIFALFFVAVVVISIGRRRKGWGLKMRWKILTLSHICRVNKKDELSSSTETVLIS